MSDDGATGMASSEDETRSVRRTRLPYRIAQPPPAAIKDAARGETDVIIAKTRETIARSRELLDRIDRDEEHHRFLLRLFNHTRAAPPDC